MEVLTLRASAPCPMHPLTYTGYGSPVKQQLMPWVPPAVLHGVHQFRRSLPFGRLSANGTATRNRAAIRNFSIPFDLLEFRFLSLEERYDLSWGWWSRVYEYEAVLQTLDRLGCSVESSVHNTCWGWHGSHVLFKNRLERSFPNTIHSDIRPSALPNTFVHDVANQCPAIWESRFDFVLNVSTIEEIHAPHIVVFERLLEMVRPGGFLIATFDYPGIQLDMFESLFRQPIEQGLAPVTGGNSPYPMPEFEGLRVGLLVVQRK